MAASPPASWRRYRTTLRSRPTCRGRSPAKVVMISSVPVDSKFPSEHQALARANQRNGFLALEQIEQAAQRFAALAPQLRIVLHDAQRLVARLRDQLGVHVGAGDVVARQAALAHAEDVALAAQPQIFL